jgi:hypothetical protein
MKQGKRSKTLQITISLFLALLIPFAFFFAILVKAVFLVLIYTIPNYYKIDTIRYTESKSHTNLVSVSNFFKEISSGNYTH